jgi:hypothetical protein
VVTRTDAAVASVEFVAVHAALLDEAVTVTTCVPPSAGALHVVGVTVTPTTACVTVIACPAMVAVALRLVTLDGFAAAVNVTLPLPVPLDALRVSHA